MNDSDLFESSAQIMKENMEPTKGELIRQLAEKLSIPIIELKVSTLSYKDLIGEISEKGIRPKHRDV